MRKFVAPEKFKMVDDIMSADSRDIVFSLSPQKKSKLDALVKIKNNDAVKALREWMERDNELDSVRRFLKSDD